MEQAYQRVILGRTVCNQLFRSAMRARADELEQVLSAETNTIIRHMLQTIIKKLRAKTFNEGPLCFGLHHQLVQDMLV